MDLGDTEKVPQTETPAGPPQPTPEPPSEPETSVEPEETGPKEVPAPVEPPKPEPITEVTVSDSEGGLSSHTSGPSADTTFSTEHNDSLDVVQSETPRTLLEDETPVKHGDSPVSSPHETEAESLVTVEKEAAEIPIPEPQAEDTSSSHQTEVPLPVSEQSEAPEASVVEPTPVELPEEGPRPITPPEDAQPSPEPEPEPPVAPVSVSIDPVPTEEATTEQPPVEKPEPAIPLDQRRRIHLEPIQVPTPEYSDDDNLLSDDSFMEELRSATVQEARPVSVKSPNGGDSWQGGSRAVSSPHALPSPSAAQALSVGRSVSSSYPDTEPPTPVLMAKKINVSSGISSRIKALEKFSSREGTPTPTNQPPAGPSASSSFESLRKRASVSFPSGSPDAPTVARQDISMPGGFSRTPSLNRHDPRPTPSAVRRTNSISVTAHIVRDNNASPGSPEAEPTESDVLNLQASPLTVEHETKEDTPSQSPTAEPANRPEDRSMSVSSAGSGRQATPGSRPGSRLSFSSRSRADENTSSPTDEKKGSRASRLMRRMSSITSTSRRSIIGALTSPVKEEDAAHAPNDNSAASPESSRPPPPDPIDIGEVNVQFPETLLWKRRFMRVDEGGYVVLLPATNDSSARNVTKRYHLTEFRTPCLPEEDMQELPNSILLDFLDGSTLQCACESRQGQATALQGKFSPLSWLVSL